MRIPNRNITYSSLRGSKTFLKKIVVGVDRSSSGSRGQFYQVAPGIVVETFNMPGQGDRVLPDVNRVRLSSI